MQKLIVKAGIDKWHDGIEQFIYSAVIRIEINDKLIECKHEVDLCVCSFPVS
jgi:hypothetical protein